MTIDSICQLYNYKGATLYEDYRIRSKAVLSKYDLKMSEGSAIFGDWLLYVDNVMTRKIPYRKKDVTVGFHIEITRNRKIVYEYISEACELFETEDDINHISTNGCYSLDDRAYLIRILTEWMNAITIPVNSSEYRVVRVRVNEGVLSESPYQDDRYMDFSGFTGYVSFKTWDSDSTVAPVYWDDETLRKLPKAYIRNSDRTGSDETGYAFYKHELYAISDPESLLWQNEAK